MVNCDGRVLLGQVGLNGCGRRAAAFLEGKDGLLDEVVIGGLGHGVASIGGRK